MKTFRTKKNYLIRIIAAIFTVAAVFSALICFALHFYNSSISYTSSGFAPANDILNNPYCGWYDMFGYTISDASADTFDKRTQDYIQKSGSTRLVLLEIKKIVIADRIGVVADKVFLHPYDYNGIFVIVGVLAYCLQLYADFSGGMDVVSGAAELYGIRLDKNFRQPFFSKSISEFWRRWHITLGTWMKDYVFYPFSLSKKMMKFSKFMKKHLGTFAGKTLPICLADLLIFFLVGVWHGAAWKFIVYGMYNGIIIAASSLLEPVYEKMFKVTHINKNAKWYRVFQIIRTFILVNIGWFFDDAANLKESFVLMKNVFVNFSIKPLFDGSVRAMMEFSSMDMLAIAVGMAALFIVGVINEKGIDIRKSLAKKPLILRWAVYLMLVMSIPVLGYVSAETGGFLYAQF